MKPPKNRSTGSLSQLIVLLFGLLPLAPLQALPSDQAQPIKILADRALHDDKQGITRYEGRVEIHQGSLHILAEKVTIYSALNGVNRILATGAPASMEQQPRADQAVIQAEGNSIDYQVGQQQITLSGTAKLAQENQAKIEGDKIFYDMAQQKYSATSPQNPPADKGESRVVVTLPGQTLNLAPPLETATTPTEAPAETAPAPDDEEPNAGS